VWFDTTTRAQAASMFTVYGIPGSPFGRSALAVLIEKEAPWRFSPLGPREAKQPEHLARHPFGRVLALDHDGFALYETQAILRYVDQVVPAKPLTPADARGAARMNQAIGITDWYAFRTFGVGIVFHRLVAPAFGMPADEAAVAAALPGSRHCLDVLEEFLGDQPFIAGAELSLADLHLGPHIDMLADCPEGAEMLAGTRLEAWLGRLRARPSFTQTTWEKLKA
jgi:glutathione S-transferase